MLRERDVDGSGVIGVTDLEGLFTELQIQIDDVHRVCARAKAYKYGNIDYEHLFRWLFGPEGQKDHMLRSAIHAAERELARVESQHGTTRSEHESALQAVAGFQAQVHNLETELMSLRNGYSLASVEVGLISKTQLNEIKQFGRSPPAQIQCLLEATWILIHFNNFRARKAVSFDSARDWPRCQRMLADGGFVRTICELKLWDLDVAPNVPMYIAANYFAEDGIAARDSGASRVRCSSRAKSPAPGVRNSVKLPGRAKVKLEVDAMAHACLPCVALLRWLHAVVFGHIRLTKLQNQRGHLEECLMAAREEELRVEERAVQAQLAVDKARQALADRVREAEDVLAQAQAAEEERKDAGRRRRAADTDTKTPLLDLLKDMRKTDPKFVEAHNAEWKASLDRETEEQLKLALQGGQRIGSI